MLSCPPSEPHFLPLLREKCSPLRSPCSGDQPSRSAKAGLRGSDQPGRGSGLRAPGDGEEAGGGLALLGDVWSHQDVWPVYLPCFSIKHRSLCWEIKKTKEALHTCFLYNVCWVVMAWVVCCCFEASNYVVYLPAT